MAKVKRQRKSVENLLPTEPGWYPFKNYYGDAMIYEVVWRRRRSDGKPELQAYALHNGWVKYWIPVASLLDGGYQIGPRVDLDNVQWKGGTMSEPTIEELLSVEYWQPPNGSCTELGARLTVETMAMMARAILKKLEHIQKNESIFWTRQELIDNLVGRIREALGDDQ